jgi:hypothetical protein
MRSGLLVLAACVGCAHDAPPPLVPPPVRDAIGDADLREMIAEIATARACDRIRDHFRAVHDHDRHTVVTGTLWLRNCSSVHDGTNVTFTVSGGGWEWVDKTTHRDGGTFVVRQYVRFDATATIAGTLDLGYDATTHVASLWFSPSRAPEVDVEPLGDIDVDRRGTWSSVVGAIGTAFARSPDRQSVKEAKREGAEQLSAQLSEGLTVTIDLCTGLARVAVGHLPKGQMAAAEVASRTELELRPGGVLMLGPQRADAGMNVHVEAPAQIDVSLACRDDAERIARAYLDGTAPPNVATLAHSAASGATDLRIPGASCPVVVVVRSLATADAPIAFTVERSASESGANGGSLVGCTK